MEHSWDPDKNKWLKENRDISFEKILLNMANGALWKISEHPNQKRYPGQRIYYVIVQEYIYLVPFVQKEDEIFLKTIIPSRKATKNYFQERGEKYE